jgi:hypothetical protein
MTSGIGLSEMIFIQGNGHKVQVAQLDRATAF